MRRKVKINLLTTGVLVGTAEAVFTDGAVVVVAVDSDFPSWHVAAVTTVELAAVLGAVVVVVADTEPCLLDLRFELASNLSKTSGSEIRRQSTVQVD